MKPDEIDRAFEAYRAQEDPGADWCDVEEENEKFAFHAGYASALDECAEMRKALLELSQDECRCDDPTDPERLGCYRCVAKRALLEGK